MLHPRASWARFGAALAWLVAAHARADGTYEGQWRQGPMHVQVQVQSWGGDCGPRPQSTTTRGGGTFQITQQGEQLTFHLRQPRTTQGCWSENRAVHRVAFSSQAGTWRIVCRTTSDDSRAETGTYTIQALGNDQLTFRDESRYDWQLNQSRCVASISTTQSFTRVTAQASSSDESSSEQEEHARCTPGAPARLVLSPSHAEVQPGGEQCFSARVVDAHGCPVRSERVTLAVEGDSGQMRGRCFQAGDDEGEVTVRAQGGGSSAQARVSVHALDLSDLIARRTETGSVGSGTQEVAQSDTAARVSARPAKQRMSLLWPGLALGVALLLVLVAVVLLRRRGASGAPKKPSIAGLPGVEIPDEEEAAPPKAASSAEAEGGAEGPRDDLICPSCRRGYPPGTSRCPHDDTPLMSYREFAAGGSKGAEAAPNVCPTCGERYPANVKFCGKDGATLQS